MKSFFFKTLILALILVQISYAENLLNLYKKYFPEKVLKNKNFRKNINNTLKIYGPIDPSLIYYYITNLDLKINKGITDSDSNFTNLLQFQINKAKLKKKKWAQSQIEKMSKEIKSIAEIRGISSYFSEFLFENVTESDQVKKLKIDTKLLDYFIYIYLSREENTKYDPSLDYKNLYIVQSKNIINQLTSAYENMERLNTSQKEKILSKAYEFVFLFKGTYLKIFPETTSFYFYEFLRKMFKDDYRNKHSIFFKISNEAVPISFDKKFKYIDYVENTYTYDHRVTFTNTTFIHLGFQFAIKETLTPFSFINVDLGLSRNQVSKISGEYTVLSSGLTAQSGLYYRWFFALDKPRDFKTHSISAQITMPVYYYSRKLFFAIGFNYTLMNYQYKFDFIKKGEYRRAYEGINIEFDEVEENHVNETNHSIYPILVVNFYPIDFINFRLEYLIPLESRLGIAVHLKF